jgi:hypothetical protein
MPRVPHASALPADIQPHYKGKAPGLPNAWLRQIVIQHLDLAGAHECNGLNEDNFARPSDFVEIISYSIASQADKGNSSGDRFAWHRRVAG